MLDIGYCFAVSQQQPCRRIGFTAKQWTIDNAPQPYQPTRYAWRGRNLMSETNSSRRKFIAQTGAGAAGLTLTAASWNNVLGANDRVRLGVIGTGNRGGDVMGVFQREPEV